MKNDSFLDYFYLVDITKLMEKIYTGPHKTIYQSQLFLLQCLAEDSEKQLIHIIDYNKLTSGDKMGKISPFMQNLKTKVQQFSIFHSKLSLDGSMVPYYDHHSAKMFIKGKPINFGYKIWTLCSSSGYPYSMRIYSGKKNWI
ncbi:piggyBac transposable element-derived protein 3 [Trichonephila clavipes]|nr:piggyBac transposable element-derived protein 3 [Trichonephila clavipes]